MNRVKGVVVALAMAIAGGVQAGEVEALLAQAKQAAGGEAWDRIESLRYQGKVAVGGMNGPVSGLERLRDGVYRSDYRIGPAKGAEGYDAQGGWSTDDSGLPHRADGKAARESAETQRWLAARAYWYPARGKAGLRADGVKACGEGQCDIIVAAPEGGREVVLAFDRKDHLLRESRIFDGSGWSVTSYADYRPVAGVKLPFAVLTRNERSQNDTAIRYTAIDAAAGVEDSAFAMPVESGKDYLFPQGKSVVSLPFELINNHIYLKARVNQRELRLMLDTGGVNLLVPDTMTALGLKSEGALKANGVGEQTVEVGLVRVPRLDVGGIVLNDTLFYGWPLKDMDAVEGVHFDGLLGYEMFRRFIVEVDYAGGVVRFQERDTFHPAKAGTPVALEFDELTPQIVGTLEGKPARFDVDTGSRSGFTVNRPYAEKHGILSRPSSPETIVGWGVGGPARGKYVRLSGLALGTVDVGPVIGEIFTGKAGSFASDTTAGNLGSGILRRFTVTFDYVGRQMYLKPNGAPQGNTADRAGLWLNAGAGGFVVAEVMGEGPAAKAGLKAGDIVTAIDGKDASKWRLADLREHLRHGAPGERVTMNFRRDKVDHKAEVELVDLVPEAH